MATFVKFQPFIEDVFEGVHIFGTHQLVAFMTTNANAPTNTFRTLTQIIPRGISRRVRARRQPAHTS
jgi:hypothetical protein